MPVKAIFVWSFFNAFAPVADVTLGPSGAFLGRALRIGIRPERVKSLVRGLVEVCAVWRSEGCKAPPLR